MVQIHFITNVIRIIQMIMEAVFVTYTISLLAFRVKGNNLDLYVLIMC